MEEVEVPEDNLLPNVAGLKVRLRWHGDSTVCSCHHSRGHLVV